MEHEVLQALLLDLLQVGATRVAPRAKIHLAVLLALRLAARRHLCLDRAVELAYEWHMQPEEVGDELAACQCMAKGAGGAQ